MSTQEEFNFQRLGAPEPRTWYKYTHPQGTTVWHIASTLAATMPMVEMMGDEPKKITPRQVARLSCDIANALVSEMHERGWIEMCEVPKS